MATIQQLEIALINADKAGDTDAARKLAAALVRAKTDTTNQIPGTQIPETIVQQKESSLLDKAVGAGETLLTIGTGATGGALGMIGGALGGLAGQIRMGELGTGTAPVAEAASRGAQSLTYMPRSASGQEQVQAVGEFVSKVLPPVIPQIAGLNALGQATSQAMPAVQATAQRGALAARQGVQKVVAPAQAVIRGERQNLSAAATPLELQRATEAEMAGLKLTKGEMQRSPQELAFEKEKAKTPEYQAPFLERQQENNRAALAKLNQVLDDTGAEAGDYANTGIKTVDALMAGWNTEKAKTRAALSAV